MTEVVKTATFALVHFAVAFSVTYALTGSIALSGAVALLEPACNTVAYYLHERAWSAFGRRAARGDPAPAIA